MSRRGYLNPALLFAVALLVIAAGAAVFFGPRLLSVIGEEGYEPYDPLLLAGTFDRARWDYIPPTCAGDYGGRLTQCQATTNYAGVTAASNAIKANPYGPDPYQLATKNLRLINFKTEFSIDTPRCGSNLEQHGGTAIYSNYGLIKDYPAGSGSTPTGSSSIELNWNDYQLGKYQIKADGIVVQEGSVPENGTLYLYTKPDDAWVGDECVAAGIMTNPRMKQVFGCDLKSGELQTDACFGGPATITTADLPGFKRFCIDQPSTFVNAGVSTPSKQVYYDLAQGKPVIIGQNQAWKFSYIANAPLIGNKTGISSNCNTVTVTNLIDFPVRDPTVNGQTLLWTSYGRYDGNAAGYKTQKNTLNSGSKAFMTTTDVQINEQLCPYKNEVQTYPGDNLTSACFSIIAFGKSFKEGDILNQNGLTVTLQRLKVQYERDPNLGPMYSWAADWRLDFDPNAVSINLAGATPTSVNDGQAAIPYTISNSLPGPGTFVTTLQVRPDILNEPITTTYTTVVNAKAPGTVAITLPAQYSGNQRAIAWNTLQTDAGAITFSTAQANYTTTVTPSNNPATGFFSSIWAFFVKLWHWLIGLFGG